MTTRQHRNHRWLGGNFQQKTKHSKPGYAKVHCDWPNWMKEAKLVPAMCCSNVLMSVGSCRVHSE